MHMKFGKPFKTLAGAQKRAAFEQAHQRHLTNRYRYWVEKTVDGFQIMREMCRPATERKLTMAKKPTIYCTSYCNFGHDLKTGKPIGHECRVIPPAALQAERDGDYAKAIEIMQADPRKPYWAR